MSSRLNLTGPTYEDGRPMGYPCPPGCPEMAPNSPRCHCRACHNTFSGPTYFDSHRQDGYCLNPVSVGLVIEDGLWSSPEGHAQRKVVSDRMTAARAGRGQQQ